MDLYPYWLNNAIIAAKSDSKIKDELMSSSTCIVYNGLFSKHRLVEECEHSNLTYAWTVSMTRKVLSDEIDVVLDHKNNNIFQIIR